MTISTPPPFDVDALKRRCEAILIFQGEYERMIEKCERGGPGEGVALYSAYLRAKAAHDNNAPALEQEVDALLNELASLRQDLADSQAEAKWLTERCDFWIKEVLDQACEMDRVLKELAAKSEALSKLETYVNEQTVDREVHEGLIQMAERAGRQDSAALRASAARPEEKKP